MDSLTQMVLGAAVAESVAGRQLGNKALMVGAALGTLPDLDVLIPFTDAVANFTYHRSFSHSFIVLTAITLPLALLGNRAIGIISFKRWLLTIFLCLNTHALLDCFTVYGTQVFWPVWTTPVGWSTIFIIDPLYTVPLIIGLVLTYRYSRKNRPAAIAAKPGTTGSSETGSTTQSTYRLRKSSPDASRHGANTIGLALSTAYLALTVGLQAFVVQRATASLERDGIPAIKLLAAPTPGSILWRIVAIDKDTYHEGFFSLLDKGDNIDFTTYDKGTALYNALDTHWPANRLSWFTKGFFATREVDGTIVMADLRMGIETSYVFQFLVGKRQNDTIEGVTSELLPFAPDIERLGNVLDRVNDGSVDLRAPGALSGTVTTPEQKLPQ